MYCGQTVKLQFPEFLKTTANLTHVSWLPNSSVDYIGYDAKMLWGFFVVCLWFFFEESSLVFT